MPCPKQSCSCESPALRGFLNLQPPPGQSGILFGSCECDCHAQLAGQLQLPNSTEALFGFLAWLTSRTEKVGLGAGLDAAPIADLLNEYIRVNRLPDARPGWETKIRTPVDQKQVAEAKKAK